MASFVRGRFPSIALASFVSTFTATSFIDNAVKTQEEQVSTMPKKGALYLSCGPSGAGKDTLRKFSVGL